MIRNLNLKSTMTLLGTLVLIQTNAFAATLDDVLDAETGNTLAHLCAKEGDIKSVLFLSKLGVNTQIENLEGKTAQTLLLETLEGSSETKLDDASLAKLIMNNVMELEQEITAQVHKAFVNSSPGCWPYHSTPSLARLFNEHRNELEGPFSTSIWAWNDQELAELRSRQ